MHQTHNHTHTPHLILPGMIQPKPPHHLLAVPGLHGYARYDPNLCKICCKHDYHTNTHLTLLGMVQPARPVDHCVCQAMIQPRRPSCKWRTMHIYIHILFERLSQCSQCVRRTMGQGRAFKQCLVFLMAREMVCCLWQDFLTRAATWHYLAAGESNSMLTSCRFEDGAAAG